MCILFVCHCLAYYVAFQDERFSDEESASEEGSSEEEESSEAEGSNKEGSSNEDESSSEEDSFNEEDSSSAEEYGLVLDKNIIKVSYILGINNYVVTGKFLQAIKKGNVKKVKDWIERVEASDGSDISSFTDIRSKKKYIVGDSEIMAKGMTALHYAAFYCQHKIVEMLLGAGAGMVCSKSC